MSTSQRVHTYDSHLVWEGSTGDGVRTYDRGHRVVTPPARTEVLLSADPHFRGDAERMNPEQLVVAAASSCQLLSFLGAAARAGVDVVAYEDEARGVMPEDDPPMRLTGIHLTPTITVANGTDVEHVQRLVAAAHDQCYIARSLRTGVTIQATVIER